MATTAAEICSLALLRIGQRQVIDDLDEDSVEAQVSKLLYEQTRDFVLASHPWAFATKRDDLAVVSGETRTAWKYVYALPTDCINPRYIHTGSRIPGPDERIPFAIEHNAGTTSRVLLTDMEDAELVYTAKIETVALFSPHFVDTLAWKLAAEFALSIPVKPQLGLVAEQKFEASLRMAAAVEMNAQREDQPPDSEFIRAR